MKIKKERRVSVFDTLRSCESIYQGLRKNHHSRVAQFFDEGCSQEEMEDVIFMLLEKWQKGE